MNAKVLIMAVLVFSAVAVGGLWLYSGKSGLDDIVQNSTLDNIGGLPTTASPGSSQGQPLYWVAPMDANYRRDEPGLSPMGMPLIPVYESGDTITVASSIQQNLGVRTESVIVEDFSPVIDAVGFTSWDESSIQMLYSRAEGWLEEFNLASVGDQVNAGDVLYELFAPNLVSAQREYLTSSTLDNQQLAAIAVDRLLALGFNQNQVEQLDSTSTINSRLVVHAQDDAIVSHIGVRKGSYVKPETPIATLVSLDRIWIETEVFESKTGWVEPGLPATVSFAAFPGESWSTEIAYIYPNLEPTTRSLRLRLVVNNVDRRLRANMFASVKIASKPRLDVLTVAREAVIRAGVGDRVIVALGEGRFRPEIVKTGVSSGSRIEIVSGLNEGDVVVTSGQFLLDSEANGEQAFARLTDMPLAAGQTNTANDNNSSGTTSTSSTTAIVYSASGVIEQIVAGSTVTIAHGPITELDWPSMVMGFQIPGQMDIGDLTVGDTVAFEFVVTAQGTYQLSMITSPGDEL